MSRTKKIISLLLSVTVCICVLFVYEVNKEHHYAPKTAEIISKIILFADDKKIKDPYILDQMR